MRLIVTIAAIAACVAACDNGASAVQTRDRAAEAAVETVQLVAASPAEASEATTEVKPPVTANRRETADAKVQRLYQRNGAAFGSRSADDYLEKIQAFTGTPPRDAETVKRANGDTLIYQASTNTFAVVARDGTPRTMFKPDDGTAYWAEQKERAPTFGQRRNAD